MKTNYYKLAILVISIFISFVELNASIIKSYTAPKCENKSIDYQITVDNQDIFCHTAEVYDTRNPEGIHFGEKGLPYSTVSFASFDFKGKVKVRIKVNRNISNAVIRPLSRNIKPMVKNNFIEFYIDKPGPLTIEPDGSDKRVLHLFSNPLEKSRPDSLDNNVIYFGPGEHVVNTIKLKSNQTIYVDGGAIVYFDAFKNDSVYRIENRNKIIDLKRYDHGIEAVNAKNIKIMGRGILDFSRVAEKYGRKNPIHINNCENVLIEGITIRGANCWHATLYRSKNIIVDNIKELAYGFNTDGMNVVLSQNVNIKNCFMRQRDDGIIMKSMDTGNKDAFINEIPQPQTLTTNVKVENCVIWSDWGYALGVTYEIRMPVKNIIFKNCDIINATHRAKEQGVIGVLVADADNAENITFENINIERSLKPLIKLEQKITEWTVNKNLGKIRNIKFSNINYLSGRVQPIIFKGFSNNGDIKNVYLKNLNFLGEKIKYSSDWDFINNDFVSNVYLNKKKMY